MSRLILIGVIYLPEPKTAIYFMIDRYMCLYMPSTIAS
jgi:hypothetical protein